MAIPSPIRKVFLVLAALLALYAALGFLVVPRIARSKIESLATAQLGRKATVGKVEFNPFSLRARLSDFALADRDPRRTLLRFDAMDVNVSAESLWRRAPVFDEIRLVRPQVEIARDAQGRLNIQDLLERPAKPAGAAETTFALNNIEIEDGSIVLDDGEHARRIAVTKLGIGIPFLSSFSRDAQIRVKPHLQGVFDGAPFALTGTATSPFEETQRATLDVNLEALPLPKYAAYAPLPNGLRLTDGALTTRLEIAFTTWKGSPRGITVTGGARLDHVAIARTDGSPLVAAGAVDIALHTLDLMNRRASVDRFAISAPVVDLQRLPDGSLEIPGLVAMSRAGNAPAPAPSPARSAAWAWSVARADVSGGTIRILDRSVAPAFQARLLGVQIDGRDLASEGTPGTANVFFDTEDGAHFEAHAALDVAGGSARGRFELAKLSIARLQPYYANALALDVRRGRLDFNGDFDAGGGTPARFTLARGTLAVSELDVALAGERDPLARLGSAKADGVAFDLAGREIDVDHVEARQAALRLLRDADGTMHFNRALRGAAAPAPARPSASAPNGPDWHLRVRELLLERFGADFEDRAASPAVKLRIADARIQAKDLDTGRGSKARFDLAARIGAKGRVRADGTFGAGPLAVDARVVASAVDLVPLRPYFESRADIVVTSGAVNAKGRVTYGDSGAAGASARYVGDVVVSDFDSLDGPTSQALARWKTVGVTGIDLTSAPFSLAIDAVALDQFYSRLILGADGKLNVLQLLRPDASTQVTPPGEGSVPAAAPAPVAESERRDIPVSIGRIQVSGGEVEYSDFFVKPNYSAHLTGFDGKVSALGAAQAGVVEITARVDGTAPVDIRGTVNPFAKKLALDLTGKATDVDLPPLTPYSVKYAGYGIEKGKLTMEVHYKLDDRKLTATNKLVLDQLTFGQHVESPTATKLPVLFAVSLLKDRNGVIDLELPISGTLDDPKFSIWGVIGQIFGNLLTKAATAPFALLGALVGGGEQLAYVEFAPGSAALTPAAEAKLASLAKALADRPALKLDAAGRAIPDVDGAGLKRAALERAIRIRKQKALSAAGESAPALEAVTADAADRAKYLKGVYGDTKLANKPRNFIGIAKDISAAEMEALLLAGYPIDENALRELASQRAQVVKDWFTSKGNIPAERIFIVAPRIGAEGLKAEGAPTRVDFAIR